TCVRRAEIWMKFTDVILKKQNRMVRNMTKTETAGVSLPKSGTERKKVRNHSLAALYRKEMTDHITSKRFVIIMILVLATTIASIYGTVTGIADALESDSNFIFLKLYTTSGSS